MSPFNQDNPFAPQTGEVPYRQQARLPTPPPAPRDASPAARRLVLGFGGGQGVVMFIGLVFMAMGSMFSFVFARGLPADFALAALGSETEGSAERSETDASMTVNGSHPRVVHFSYVIDGVAYEGESSMFERAPAPRSTVRVEYLRFAKGVSRLQGTTRNEGGYTATIVLVFPMIGALVFGFTLRANLRRRRAFRFGVPTTGTVTFNGIDRSTRINGRNPTKITWSFVDARGRPFKGSLSNMDPSAFLDYALGTVITVLYLPSDPKANTIWVA